MPYYAVSEEAAKNGLMFFKQLPLHNPDTHRVIFVNGEFVCVPREAEKVI